ncbi:MAG: PAS domain-containing protein [Alphaproteobacteria bacterium]|nr:PAS domain-containing protein [Alphaproteobacteria bacterium]
MKRYSPASVASLVFAVIATIGITATSASSDPQHVDFSSPGSVLSLSRALVPYHGPTVPGCTQWHMLNAVNQNVRPATRVLLAGEPAGTGLGFFAMPTRPEIADVASSDDKVYVERIGAYGHRAFRVTLPPAASVALAICTFSTRRTPSLLAWTEPALSQHNRNLAIFVAAVAGLIGASAAIVGGLAAMSGHAAPRWAAIALALVLLTRLAATGMFDASLATPLGGPYGLLAFISGLSLAAGAMLADAVVPIAHFLPGYRRAFRLGVLGVVFISALAYVGLPGAIDLVDSLVVVATAAIAAYLVQCGRLGSLAARVLAPSAVVFALVAFASAVSTLGGFGDSLIAGDVAGGFAAAGAVLLALAVAADEGLAGIDLKRLPPRGTSTLLPASKAPPAELSSADPVSSSHQSVFDLDLVRNALALTGAVATFAGTWDGVPIDHRQWSRLVHPDDLETYVRVFQDYRLQPGIGFRLEFRARGKSGRYAWFELRASMLGKGSKAERCLGLIADITARKESEVA